VALLILLGAVTAIAVATWITLRLQGEPAPPRLDKVPPMPEIRPAGPRFAPTPPPGRP
jgi:hypothetical protein